MTASLDPALTLAASDAIEQFARPVRLAWGVDDDLFPLAHGQRLAAAFPNSSLVEIDSCGAFVMLDQPGALAAQIREVVTG